MRRTPPLDYLEDVYLFHCRGNDPDECCWVMQSDVDGAVTCKIKRTGAYCAWPIPKRTRRNKCASL